MKRITMLLAAGISIFAATQMMSCKKKDKDEATIVGAWKSQTLNYKISSAGVVYIDSTEAYTGNEITFNSDNTFKAIDLNDSSNNDGGTYSTSGSKLYSVSSDGSKDTIDYSVSSTELILSSSETDGSTVAEYKFVFSRK